jgi:Domain of unknown function (DUF4157)
MRSRSRKDTSSARRPGAAIVPQTAAVERALSGASQPLESGVRRDMEQRFGHDFSRVRVHIDPQAQQSAHDVHARAYTVGRDIAFGPGRYAPATPDGRRLLGHELTHVVQQSRMMPGGPPVVQRDLEDWAKTQDRLENYRQLAEARYLNTGARKLNAFEKDAARIVFGSALDTSDVLISEGGLMTLGGYARTLPNRIHFPNGSFSRPDFLAYLIHELTHVWQYQRGAEIPGMIYEAIVGNYDYGKAAGLREAWESGKAFDEFTTEQQGDILSDYYTRVTEKLDTTAYDGFVAQVRTGKEKEHRYKTVQPLPAGTLDVAKLNEEYRAKTEAEIVRELRRPMGVDDPRAITRAERLIELFRRLPYWAAQYRERIEARRADDTLVTLLFTRISGATRGRIFRIFGFGTRPRGWSNE